MTDKYDYVTFVNCYEKFYDDSTKYCKAEYVFDGLHPNEKGYAAIAEVLNPLLGEDKSGGTGGETGGETGGDEPDIPAGSEENVIFEGSQASKDSLASVEIAKSGFNMEKVIADGCFYVEYEATEKLDMNLALSRWNPDKWVEVNADKAGIVKGKSGTYFAQYSFDACKTAYESADLSDVNALCIKAAGKAFTLKVLKWYGPKVTIPYELLYKGTSSEQKGPSAGPAHYFYTKHVGGDFDAAQLKLDSYFTLQYTSSGNAESDAGARLTVALSSASDTDNATDNHWVAVTAAETKKLDNGEYLSKYTIEDCVKAFGKNVKRLDQIQVYTPYNAAAETVFVLKEMKYYAGDGALVDTDGETAWTNKAKTGIGFIGDSICQNAMLRYNNWNTILNRKDCTDTNWGIGGQNTTQISRRIGDMLSSADYEKIVVLCGINDLGHGITKEQFIENYKTIIETIHREQAQTQVYAISILPTKEPFYNTDAEQQEIRDRNTALKELTEKYEYATFVNCYDKFYDNNTKYCKVEYVFDGLHPNEKGYAAIAEVLNPLLGEDKGGGAEDDEPDPTPSDELALSMAKSAWSVTDSYQYSGTIVLDNKEIGGKNFLAAAMDYSGNADKDWSEAKLEYTHAKPVADLSAYNTFKADIYYKPTDKTSGSFAIKIFSKASDGTELINKDAAVPEGAPVTGIAGLVQRIINN